ncbi:hypothetical protein Aeqsu_0532 [Aequorivita sublithincola DSM 14238]|uniref:Outer membrane protein beta-barrel domain-containing protein n=1 Tax=Aequorivita sublithincola (strain DSM 14238 / LMG 21431 / ACAM 643 / 9-3) TaxID=746697 RepID=I3YSS6_AEQSU|nr:hypothetical protein [Aequorivita sublithincola]AFL80044.1 hypothetical protein Aeqsu_0532 [Aequorivita sublithincola DSM 14238]
MKSLKNKFIFFGVVCFLTTFITQAQNETSSNSFSYRSFSVSPLGVYVGSNSGPYLTGDVSFDYGKSIFSLAGGFGTEGNFIGSSDDIAEVNFLYGRSFPLGEKIFTEVYIGAGYFHYNTYGLTDEITRTRGDIDESTIGFPIGAKLQFKLGERYSMGLKLGGNINAVESIATVGLVLQWNRKRN